MVELFANSGDPYQMPHAAASDLGLHCLPNTCLWVSSLHWVKTHQPVVKFTCSKFRTKKQDKALRCANTNCKYNRQFTMYVQC